jgi:hypothetical protein
MMAAKARRTAVALCEPVAYWFRCLWIVVGAFVLGAMDIHDRGRLGKKLSLYAAGWMTWWSSKWTFDYATILLTKDAATMAAGAAVIASVASPVLALTGWIIKKYLEDSADQRRVEANTPSSETLLSQKTTG